MEKGLSSGYLPGGSSLERRTLGDRFVAQSGQRFVAEAARAVAAEVDGVPLRVIGLDDLIVNKSAVGRAQDRIDVESLERVRRGGA